jgi:hypothetical protein
MVKNNIKKHYIVEYPLKGKKFRADRNSYDWNNKYDDYFDITITGVVDTVVHYHCMSSVEEYNNTIRTTSLCQANKIIGSFWLPRD